MEQPQSISAETHTLPEIAAATERVMKLYARLGLPLTLTRPPYQKSDQASDKLKELDKVSYNGIQDE
jgi:predicted aconitase